MTKYHPVYRKERTLSEREAKIWCEAHPSVDTHQMGDYTEKEVEGERSIQANA